MDTRQLAAFCAVVERRSFSQAAERLGVTQPAVSLQVRALEKRLGTQLLDRSGRRVEPTEAGLRLYRGAQRLLTLEGQILDEIAGEGEGELSGELQIGASTGPAAIVVPLLLCEFQREHPGVRIALTVADTQAVVERVAARELELGIVGAARRHRAVAFEPFFDDEVILACPPGHAFAGRTVSLEELRGESLIVMQEGAGVRQIVEDELRSVGTRLRDLDVRLELGLQESVRSAVQAGYGVTFISRSAVEPELAAGSLTAAKVEGLDAAARDLARARLRPDADARRRRLRRVRPRQAAGVIVRWGIEELPALAGERPLVVASPRWRDVLDARGPLGGGAVAPDRGAGGRRHDRRDRRRQRDRHGQGGLGRERAAARLGADDVLRRGVDVLLRRPRSRPPDARRRRRREPARDRLRAEADARSCRSPRRSARR